MATFNLPFGIKISNNNVLDASRYVVNDVSSRDFIITDGRAYEGMQTYVSNDKKLYILSSLSPVTWNLVGTDPSAIANIYAYIDGSLYALNASINSASFATNSSIGTWNSTYINPSLGAKVSKSGDTMTGALTISTGGLIITSGDVSIMGGDTYVSQHLHVGGNLQIDGSLIYTNISSISVSTGFIQLSTGITGAPPLTLQSGIIVNRGNQPPYIFVYDEDQQTFRIGISQLETSTHYSDASTQAVATRQDAPVSNGVSFWNNTLNRFDTSSGFTIYDFATNSSVNLAFGGYATNSSIASAAFAKNVSLGALYSGLADVSSGIPVSNSFNRTSQVLTITRRDGGTLTAQFDKTYIKESSLGTKFFWNSNLLDVSIAPGVTSLSALTDVSIVTITDKNLLQYDSVSGKWRNVSMADASNYFWSSSVALLREASLNMAKFNWVGGLLEPSAAGGSGGVSQSYVDGSLLTRDLKIAQHDASIIRIDASLNNVIDVSIILGAYATNSSVNLALGAYATNASVNSALFTTNASFGNYTGTTNIVPLFRSGGFKDSSIIQIDSSVIIGSFATNFTSYIYNPILYGINGTNYFKFNGGVPEFQSTANQLLSLKGAGPGLSVSWVSASNTLKLIGNTVYGGTSVPPSIMYSSAQQITTPNGNKGGDVYLQGGGNADVSYGGGDVIIAGGLTGVKYTGKIKMYGLDSSIRTKVIYFDPDASTIGYGNAPSATLSGLSDVSIVSIADNNLLKYDSASGKWKNVSGLDASAYFQLKITKNTVPGTGSTGNTGDWSYDASYMYLCTSTNKWGRILLDYGF